MKKRRILLGLALAAAAVFSLSACDEKAPADPEPEVVVTPPAEGDGEEEVSKVDMNGTKYESIKKALEAVPANSTETFTITVEKGTYEENGLAYNGSATIHIKGNTTTKYGADVIIKGHGSDMKTEKGRSLVAIQGTGNIILENLTLQSDWGRTIAAQANMASNTQAEVLGTDTKGNTVAYNCSFKSNQDTLRTAGKAWFYGCYVEGDVDFIWMEQAGSVALYEKCEIVSVYDATASTHASYVAAPRMTKNSKVGKGLVIYNSTVKESAEAKEKNQQTYLCRNPWSSSTDYYNQVAYINTVCEDIEADLYKYAATKTEYDPLAIGWKMDQATATSLNHTGDDILPAEVVSSEFNGRKTILNRVYNAQKQKYERDSANIWDIDALIAANHWTVDADASSDTLSTDTAGKVTQYLFNDTQDVSSLVSGFSFHSSSKSYSGASGSTITIPVEKKSYVEVYGFYSGTVEVTADTQEGKQVMFFNNSSTSAEMLNTFVVYDDNARTVTLTAKSTTYITKIIVTEDTSIEETKVTGIDITANKKLQCVGVPLILSASITPKTATNKSVVWSSSAPSVGTIDPYTGKVAFVSAGEVTFTATACDGSGVSKSVTCNPVDPKWTVAEWYTTEQKDNSDTEKPLSEEEKATEISAFDVNSSNYKKLTKSYTFTDASGDTITTAAGLKLNGNGKLSISTTKGNATLTVVIVTENGQIKSAPSVSDGTTTLQAVSSTVNADTTTTYVYKLPSAGTWNIERGDTQSENNPILYAKCEYETKIKSDYCMEFSKNGIDSSFTGDKYKWSNTKEIGTENMLTVSGTGYSNSGYLQFSNTGTVSFDVVIPAGKTKAVLTINYYYADREATVKVNNGDAITGTAGTASGENHLYSYDITESGTVTIVGNTSTNYLNYISVVFE